MLGEDKNPNIMRFLIIDEDRAAIFGNAGQQEVVVIRNADGQVVFVEQNGEGNVFTYTINRNDGTAIWNKAYFAMDTPIALMALGRCSTTRGPDL
ncbi:MAG: hypothetical protein IPJ88_04785 [Myxococcales bacterium]|nr:MAG: hypothetical protein IPJ88_04785 [Myxococcales bacterium]